MRRRFPLISAQAGILRPRLEVLEIDLAAADVVFGKLKIWGTVDIEGMVRIDFEATAVLAKNGTSSDTLRFGGKEVAEGIKGWLALLVGLPSFLVYRNDSSEGTCNLPPAALSGDHFVETKGHPWTPDLWTASRRCTGCPYVGSV